MTRVLAANAGNTALKLALFDGGQRTWSARWDNARLAEELAALAWDGAPPTLLLAASVRPATDATLEALAARLGAPWRHVSRDRLGLEIRVEAPERVGIDRLLAARAALARRRAEWIVVDCGTAITVDRVTADGAFLGGMIAPGAGLGARALAEHAALLPHVALREAPPPLGRDTEGAIAAGLYWGFRGLVAGMVQALGARTGWDGGGLLVTGGDGPLLARDLPGAELAEDLTLEGLAVVAGDA